MDSQSQIADKFDKTLTLEEAQEDDDEEEDSVSSDFEFSFAAAGDTSSPVSAEEIFHNGQIRPIFPFNVDDNSDEATTTSYGPPVRKLFVKSSPDRDDIAEGPYCGWSSSEKLQEKAPAPAPEMSRKSNSTGFSKLWRFRDRLVRSHSDGKDAFVFLTGKGEETSTETTSEKKVKGEKSRAEKKECETTTWRGEKKTKTKTQKKKGKEKEKEKSAYEVLYGKREKKTGKGMSYLPYKQELVGFFTNVNGMSRNVHPY